MAAPTNYDQTNEWLAEVDRRVQDLINILKGGINVGQSGTLGNLALINNLDSAPIGNLTTLLTRLTLQGVAGRSATGTGSLVAESLVGRFFAGARTANNGFPTGDLNNVVGVPSDIYWCSNQTSNKPGTAYGVVIHLQVFNNFYQIFLSGYGSNQNTTMHSRFVNVSSEGVVSTTSAWSTTWDSTNTTVDSNGFIKRASPIFRLANSAEPALVDGTGFTEAGAGAANGEAIGATATHDDVGVYTIHGSLGFATEGWTIEVPQCINGNRLVFVETEQSDDGTITVRTFKPGTDEPMDIPEGRWIDLRLSMPEPPSDEYPNDEPAPELTPEQQEQQRIEQLKRWRSSAAITPRQARLELLNEGLLSQVAPAIDSLDSPAKERAEIEWEYATTIERDSQWINDIGAALGLDQEGIDNLFIAAAQL